ncbi:MAG TPA: ThuA domain-containing protein [Lunatimonas sp.]|nr:ThuA domain-containing protein [Lunatimonas sp.]
MKTLLLICVLGMLTCVAFAQEKNDLQVLLITGGHDFDRTAFFQLLHKLQGMTFTEVKHPNANDYFLGNKTDAFDVILFYDMVQDISLAQMEGFEKLVEKGIGLVFLHHSIVSYQGWDYYKNTVGGRYHERGPMASNYKHEVDFNAKLISPSHPVLQGLEDFEVFDEIYGNVEIGENVNPLIKTDHPDSMPYLAWSQDLNPNSRSVYIQPGHGPEVFSLQPFQQLLKQALSWAAFRHR